MREGIDSGFDWGLAYILNSEFQVQSFGVEGLALKAQGYSKRDGCLGASEVITGLRHL